MKFLPLLRGGVLTVLLAFAPGFANAGTVSDCHDCGTVRSVDVMNKSGKSSGGGAVIGAVVGGVVGHQVGSGRGNDAATAAGAVGGAVAGNEAEKSHNTGSYYRVTVDMDSGGTKEVNVADPSDLAKGSRVRLSGNNLERISG